MSGSYRSTLIATATALLLAWAMPASAQQGWTGAVTDLAELPGDSRGVTGARVAADPAGNVVAVWDGDGRIQAARFTAASRTWSQPVDIGLGESPTLLMDLSSNAIAIWTGREDPHRLYAARYAAATGGWSTIAAYSAPARKTVGYHRAVIDGAGNATVVWVDSRYDLSTAHVRAAHYTASSGTWTVSDLSSLGATGTPDLGVDAAGNVTVIWNGDVDYYVHLHPYFVVYWARTILAARFTPASGTWGPVTPMSNGTEVGAAQVAVDAEGNATAMWLIDGVAKSARYGAGRGWSAPVEVASGVSPILRSNPAGKVLVVWQRSDSTGQGVVQASEYQADTGTWSPPTDLSTSDRYTGLNLAVDFQGNATAVWARGTGANHVIQASRYTATTETWSGAVDLAAGLGGYPKPRLAWDPAGNVLAYWQRYEYALASFEAARWSAGSGAWGAVAPVASPSSLVVDRPEVAVDAAGNAMAVWRQCSSPYTDDDCFNRANVVRTMQWLATPAAPVVADVGIGDGSLSVAFAPPATSDPAFVPLNFEYSLDNGATWTARVPASTSSPLVIPSLMSGTLYGVRLRAVNVAGAGAASATAWSAPGPAAGPPINVSATIAGSQVTLDWTVPDYTAPPTGYVVEGGAHPGAVAASVATGSTLTHFTFVTPADTFYLRVHALTGAARSAPSNEIRVYVFTPGPPGNLTAAMNDRQVTLLWTAPPNSVAPTGYVVEGGQRPGEVLASIPTGSSATQFVVTVPYGAWYVRVHAMVGAVKGAASREVAVRTPPPAPSNLLGLVNGSTLVLSWRNPETGAPLTGLMLTVTGALSATLPLPIGESFTFEGVPPGTYLFTLAAANAAGTSAPSNAVSLTFPDVCSGTPAMPVNAVASRDGHVIRVTWDAPVTGPAVTGYLVRVTGAYVGTFATAARSLSGAVAPGTYQIRVVATNPCGSSAPTTPQTVVMP